MKKFVTGIFVGCLLTISSTVIAENDSIVGKIVEGTMPLFIDGNRADKDLIVVDGTTYAPMRSASSYFGYNIEYIPDKKEVSMVRSIEKSIKLIPVMNLLNPNIEKTNYMVYENEIAVAISAVGGEAQWDGELLTLTMNENTINGTKSSRLENGDPVGLYEGSFYVKLSQLGLKGTLNNGKLIIE